MRNKKTIWAAVVVGLFLLYTLVGFLLVPWIVKGQMLKRLPEYLDREVAVEKVRFNPYTLVLQIEGFSVTGKDGEPLIGAGHFLVNVQASSVFKGGLMLKELELDQPFIRIVRDDSGELAVTDLLQKYGSPAETEPEVPEEEKEMFLVRVYNLSVRDGRLSFLDNSTEIPYSKEVENIRFDLANLSTAAEESGSFEFGAQSEGTESFFWSGTLGLNPVVLSGELGVNSLDIAKFRPYIHNIFRARIQSGYLSTQAEYAVHLQQEGLEVKISNGSADIRDYQVVNLDSDEPLFGFEHLMVDQVSAELSTRAVVVETVNLNNASIFIHRYPEGEFNFIKAYDPMRKSGNESDAEPQPEPELKSELMEELTVVIKDIQSQDTALRIFDESLAEPLDLNLSVPEVRVTNLSNTDQPYTLELQMTNDGPGRLDINASGTLFPLVGESHLILNDWSLTNLNPVLQEFTNALLKDGSLDMVLNAAYQEDIARTVRLWGGFAINNWDVRELLGEKPFSNWKQLEVKGIEYVPSEQSLSIDSVFMDTSEQYLRMEPKGLTNFHSILKLPDPVETEEPKTGLASFAGAADAAAAFNERLQKDLRLVVPEEELETIQEEIMQGIHVWLDELELSNNSIFLEDQTRDPVVKLSIEEANSTISGLSSDPAARPKYHFDAKINGQAALVADGTFNFLIGYPYVDVEVRLSGLDLRPFDPYSRQYAGYQLRGGDLSLDLDYFIEDMQLDSENRAVLHQLTFGEKTDSEDAVKLPILLGVALLKDPEGNINIDVPVEGDLLDPEFKLSKMIWQTVGNLITRLAASPFKILGGLVGSAPENLNSVSFEPGTATIVESSQKSLAALAQALQKRPAVSLGISASTMDPNLELAGARQAKLRALLEEESGLEFTPETTAEERYRAMVEAVYKKRLEPEQQGPPLPEFAVMERYLLSLLEVTGDDLNLLAEERKEAVRDYLVQTEGIDPERIFLSEEDELQLVEDGASRVELSIR